MSERELTDAEHIARLRKACQDRMDQDTGFVVHAIEVWPDRILGLLDQLAAKTAQAEAWKDAAEGADRVREHDYFHEESEEVEERIELAESTDAAFAKARALEAKHEGNETP